MNACNERLLQFDCENERLLGVLCEPQSGTMPGAAAVLIVVGGPQYRVGAHRQYVKLARALARAGHASLRFDVRGMGDGGGAGRSFESITPDIAAALDALAHALPSQTPLILFGLCDGASAAMLYLDERRDARIAGLCGANPWVRSESGLARTQLRHYYLRRLASGEFWRKLLKGGVGLAALRELGGKLGLLARGAGTTKAAEVALPYMERMARGCATLPPDRLALALSGEDLTAREFETYCATSPRWVALLSRRAPVWRFPGIDHTFSQPQGCTELARAMLGWMAALPVSLGDMA